MENTKENVELMPNAQETISMAVDETIESRNINKAKDLQTDEHEEGTEQSMETNISDESETQSSQQEIVKRDIESDEHAGGTEKSMETNVISDESGLQSNKQENVNAVEEQTIISQACDKYLSAENEPVPTDNTTTESITTNSEIMKETCANVIEDIVLKKATALEANEVEAVPNAESVNEEAQNIVADTIVEVRPIKEEPVEFVNAEKQNTIATKRNPVKTDTVSSLSLLAQYNSDEEHTDDENAQQNVTSSQEVDKINYRDLKVEVPSSESDSDSDSGTELTQMLKIINKNNEDDDEDDDDDEEAGNNAPRRRRQPPRVKGEMLLDDLPPIEDLHITVPEEECKELGQISSIVEQLVLVTTRPNCELLDLQTVLFLDKGKRVLGEIFDVIGQVTNPLYCVRFNSRQQIDERSINIGDVVYVAPKTEYTQFIVLANLMRVRGSDASWENDIEPPPRYLDYSDDEQERAARAKRRNKDRRDDSEQQNNNDDDDASKRGRVITVDSDNDSESEAGDRFPRRRNEHMSAARGRGRRLRGRNNAESGNQQYRQQDMYAQRPPMRTWPPRPQYGYGMPPANPFYNMYNPAMQPVGIFPGPPPPPPTQQFPYGGPPARRGGRYRAPTPMYNAPMYGPPVYVMNPFAYGGAVNVPSNTQQTATLPPPPPAPPGAE